MGPSLLKALLAAGLVVAVVTAGGCRSAKIDEASVEQANAVPPVDAGGMLPAKPVTGSLDYRIGPMDVLEIEVFGVEELTRSVRVSQGGEFSMPLIGRVSTMGLTVSELEAEIARKLKEHYMEDPQVTVFVKEYLSQRVTVEGAVEAPGTFPLKARTSLLQVLAEAKGLEDMANPAGIVIFRNLDGRRYAAVFDIREIRAGRMVDPEVIGDDVVVVDYSAQRANLRDFLFTIPAIAFFMVL